ncbi:cephaeline 6'-O-methyltransferase CiOMT-like [Carex rostrata]
MELSRFINLSLSAYTPFALKCAAELKISDHIHAYDQHAMPLKELARSIPVAPEKEPMLGQVMRLLVHQGVFAQSEEGYMLTPVSELMLSKGSDMGAYICFHIHPQLVNAFSIMSNWLKSSDLGTIYQMKHEGKSPWESTKENPEFGNLFNEAMASHSRKLMKDVVASCPQLFDGLKSLVDVGGGTGTTVKVIAETFPELRCTVFDLPHVISNALKCELFDAVGGNMFEKIPAADAVMLKNILHDWPDDDCIKILERCREAILPVKAGCKVIIVELTVDLETHDQMAIETTLCFDLGMLMSFAAKERSKQEWHNVFQAAGFVNYEVHTVGVYSIYELFP